MGGADYSGDEAPAIPRTNSGGSLPDSPPLRTDARAAGRVGLPDGSGSSQQGSGEVSQMQYGSRTGPSGSGRISGQDRDFSADLPCRPESAARDPGARSGYRPARAEVSCRARKAVSSVFDQPGFAVFSA